MHHIIVESKGLINDSHSLSHVDRYMDESVGVRVRAELVGINVVSIKNMAQALSAGVDAMEPTVIDIDDRQLICGYVTNRTELLLQVTDIASLWDFQLVLDQEKRQTGSGCGRKRAERK